MRMPGGMPRTVRKLGAVGTTAMTHRSNRRLQLRHTETLRVNRGLFGGEPTSVGLGGSLPL